MGLLLKHSTSCVRPLVPIECWWEGSIEGVMGANAEGGLIEVTTGPEATIRR